MFKQLVVKLFGLKFNNISPSLLLKCLVLLLAISVAFASEQVVAAIYKWVDEDGRVHLADKPPRNVASETVDLKFNTYTSPQLYKSDLGVGASNRVIMYSAVWCGVCKKARAYFKQKDIVFKEYDIEKSAKGKRDFKRLGGRGVPVILVGSQRLNGFSVKSFEKIY